MKGVVFNLLEDVVSRSHGADVWDDLLDAAGLDGSYTSLGSYPDAELERLVACACEVLGLSRAEVLRWFGRQAMGRLVELYPVFFEQHATARGFIMSVNSIIHPEVRKLYAGAGCPNFQFSETEDGGLAMGYHSTRRLCALAEGFAEGASDHYGETVRFEHYRCVERGDERCVFHVRWPALDAKAPLTAAS